MADNEPQAVLVSTTPDGITTITLNRPHRRNAVDPPTARKLAAAFAAFEQDPGQKVCVLHGAHGTFCAGFDLHALAGSGGGGGGAGGRVGAPDGAGAGAPAPTPAAAAAAPAPGRFGTYVGDADAHRRGSNSGPMGPSRMQPSKPVISAVSGHAVAGGLELALVADLRVADDDAVFGVFCRRFGVPLIDGGTARLPAIVGLGRALDLVLTGRPVPAREALQLGLVNRVVPAGSALAAATALARQLLVFPQACLNADRASVYHAAYAAASFEDALRHEFEHGVAVVETEGVRGAASFSCGEGRHGAFEAAPQL